MDFHLLPSVGQNCGTHQAAIGQLKPSVRLREADPSRRSCRRCGACVHMHHGHACAVSCPQSMPLTCRCLPGSSCHIMSNCPSWMAASPPTEDRRRCGSTQHTVLQALRTLRQAVQVCSANCAAWRTTTGPLSATPPSPAWLTTGPPHGAAHRACISVWGSARERRAVDKAAVSRAKTVVERRGRGGAVHS